MRQINPAVAGVFPHPPFAEGGGGRSTPPADNSRTNRRSETHEARQTKEERDETIHMNTLKLNFEVTGRVKVRSNT